MLPAQVEYWKLKENQRHNLRTEGQTDISLQQNWVDLGIKRDSLDETKRHNVVSETLGYEQLGESRRHNLATENVSYQQLGLGYAQLDETNRHNIQSEAIGFRQASAALGQAAAAGRQAEVAHQRQVSDALYNVNRTANDQQLSEAQRKQAAAAEKQAEVAQQRADTAQYEAETRRAQAVGNFVSSSGVKYYSPLPESGSGSSAGWWTTPETIPTSPVFGGPTTPQLPLLP